MFQRNDRNNLSFTQADVNSSLLAATSKPTTPGIFQLKNMRSQLSFMITENETLRKEVKSLNRSLQHS